MIATDCSQSLQTVLSDLERLARELGAPLHQAFADLSLALTQPRLRLAVIGPTGAGKSSLINALLARALLPEGRLKTTGRVVAVTTWGEVPAFAGARADGGSPVPLSEGQFLNACLGSGRWSQVGASVAAAEPLPVPITLVDTPGLDPSDLAVRNACAKADGLILVIDYRSDLAEQTVDLLRELGGKVLLLVVNFCPSPRPDERTAALGQRLALAPTVPTLPVMDRATAGFPAAPIRAALQALVATDHRVQLARKTLVWEAMKLWQGLDLALTVLETESFATREGAAAAEGRSRQLAALRDQAVDCVTAWRARVEELLVAQITERLVQTELDARCANVDFAIGQMGAELRIALRGLLDQAPTTTMAPSGDGDAPQRYPLADSTPPHKKYLVKQPRDPASLKAELLHRYRTAAADLATQLRTLIYRHFDGLIAAQEQRHQELSASAQVAEDRLRDLRCQLQAAGERLRHLP